MSIIQCGLLIITTLKMEDMDIYAVNPVVGISTILSHLQHTVQTDVNVYAVTFKMDTDYINTLFIK